MNIKQITIDILSLKELCMRNQINTYAKERNYNKIAFGKGITLGESSRNSLNSKWLNVLRLLSGLINNTFDWSFVHKELALNDIDTLKSIHQAME